jgi:hypothetical protein
MWLPFSTLRILSSCELLVSDRASRGTHIKDFGASEAATEDKKRS